MPNNNHNTNNSLNPFSPQYPAQPEYFADRKRYLDDFRATALNSARLKIPTPVNYAILGTWGQGKTSLLYKFRQMVLEDLSKDIRCACIYYPLSPECCRDWNTFTSYFLRSLRTSTGATGSIKSKVMKETKRWEVKFNLGFLEAGRRAENQEANLLEALEGLWKDYLGPSGIQVAFILLDDLHYFPIKAEDSAYLTMRTTFQELVNRKCNYSLIVTAHKLLFSEIAELAEPALRFFRRLELEPFTFDEAKEAITLRMKSAGSKVKVEDEVIKVVVDKTKGHPYLVMFTMYETLNLLGRSKVVTEEQFMRVWPKIEDGLSSAIFTQKFRSASEKERELMIQIAETKREYVSPSDFSQLKGASVWFSRLEQKELLLRHDRGKYSLFHPLFADYLRRQ